MWWQRRFRIPNTWPELLLRGIANTNPSLLLAGCSQYAHTHTHTQTNYPKRKQTGQRRRKRRSNNCELSNWKKWKCIHPNDDRYIYTHTHISIVCFGFETDSENFEVKCDHGFHMKRETSRQSEVRLIRFVIVVTNGCVVDVCVCVEKKTGNLLFF